MHSAAAAAAAAAKSRQSCLTLCDHIDGSPPGSSVPVYSNPLYYCQTMFSPQILGHLWMSMG